MRRAIGGRQRCQRMTSHSIDHIILPILLQLAAADRKRFDSEMEAYKARKHEVRPHSVLSSQPSYHHTPTVS